MPLLSTLDNTATVSNCLAVVAPMYWDSFAATTYLRNQLVFTMNSQSHTPYVIPLPRITVCTDLQVWG